MAPMPTYGEDGFPGYPFFIPGEAGHRAPQAPMDFYAGKDGGLPRHVFEDGDVFWDRHVDENPVASGLFGATRSVTGFYFSMGCRMHFGRGMVITC